MTRIPFIEARFFDPAETRHALECRFAVHLRKLRAPHLHLSEESNGIEASEPDLDIWDMRRIQRHAKRILARREAVSGLDHLRKEDRERLGVFRDGARLIRIDDEHRADEIAAEIHAVMPWMSPATDLVWHAMRRSVREGWPGLRVPPILLDGPPGIGKSHWARLLGDAIAAPTMVIEATGENASFGVVGSQRGWGGSCPGRVIETIIQNRIANPVVVVDEIEKAGTPTSTKGLTFGLPEALLPLLEPMTARRWSCPYFQVRFDMGWVMWVLTCNNHRLLPEPLLSRCPPLMMRNPSFAELVDFVRREGLRRKLSDIAIASLIEALEHPFWRGRPPSLRVVIRMLNRAADLENRPPLH